MIHHRMLTAALARLQALDAPPRLVDDDRWRVTQGYYGPLGWPAAAQGAPVVLLLGARSGLEAALHAIRNPLAQVIVVEPGHATRREIAGLASTYPGVRLCARPAEARALLRDRAPDFVRVDGATFSLTDVEDALDGLRCGHLCGTFLESRIDPMQLYRRSRDVLARSFFWREDRHGGTIGGDRGEAEVEVSVIIPAYKVAGEVDGCLRSLALQTLERLEVLVIDDGSPDDTAQRALRWAEHFPGRVKVISQPNGGPAAARMTGMRLARGEYIGFVDADDWVDHRTFAELYRAAILGGADIAQCGFAEVFADGSTRDYPGMTGIAPGWPAVTRDLAPHLVERPTIWRRIYRRDLLSGKGIVFPEHIRRFDDLPFQFEALCQAGSMATIPDVFYSYRQDRPEQTIGVRDERLFIHFPIFDWLRHRVMRWADARIERQMLRVELNTHVWALQRLEKRLRWDYLRRAADQVARNRVHLGHADILRGALGSGVSALRIALLALARHPRLRPAGRVPAAPEPVAAE
jgi:glycosyltransferase involved in cell wall biosynthesis